MPVERDAFPEILKSAENDLITKRREKAGGSEWPAGHTGLAISGGGIRSASFSLGVLQTLARAKLLRHFDYLSTVSGGGYIGGFLESLFMHAKATTGGADTCDACGQKHSLAVDRVECQVSHPLSRPVAWLRENGRYLSPNGSGDTLLAIAVLLRNWVAINLVLDVFLLAAFVGLDWTHAALDPRVPREIPPQWRSPALLVSIVALAACAFPAGWAYWLVRSRVSWRAGLSNILLAVAVLLLAIWQETSPFVSLRPEVAIGAAVIAAMTLVLWAMARGFEAENEQRARRLVSTWMKGGLFIAILMLAVAAVDLAGGEMLKLVRRHELYHWLAAAIAAIVAALGTIATATQRIAALFAPRKETRTLSLPLNALAMLAAAVVAGILLVLLAAGAHALTWDGAAPVAARAMPAFGVLAVLAFLLGQGFPFLNLSSQATFYSARLTRAYLGASNPKRTKGEGQRVTEVIAGDDIPWSDYAPHAHGGPLHIINVTVNETLAGRSQIEQRDRKGLCLALGPAGLSASVGHHATWNPGRAHFSSAAPTAKDAFRIFQGRGTDPVTPEALTVGTWLALSGAAISTGLGSRTSRGLSVLCGLMNLRLGRWWDSGVRPRWRSNASGRTGVFNRLRQFATLLFPVQAYLLDELLARFPGVARKHWYLTDGGHFENTGAYELIRRQVPFIVLIDAGEDADYQFSDLANLVRKARIDFNAEVEFPSAQALDQSVEPSLRGFIGTRAELRESRTGGARQVTALLARVKYEDGKTSTLLVLKPTVTAGVPLDVQQYAEASPPFPQQSTADQYFDEEQWESYRCLGAYVAEKVFGGVDSAHHDKWWVGFPPQPPAPPMQTPTSPGVRPVPPVLQAAPR